MANCSAIHEQTLSLLEQQRSLALKKLAEVKTLALEAEDAVSYYDNVMVVLNKELNKTVLFKDDVSGSDLDPLVDPDRIEIFNGSHNGSSNGSSNGHSIASASITEVVPTTTNDVQSEETTPTSTVTAELDEGKRSTRDILYSKFAEMKLREAIQLVLEEAGADAALSASDLVTAMFTPQNEEEYTRAKNWLSTELSMGVKKGYWERSGRGQFHKATKNSFSEQT